MHVFGMEVVGERVDGLPDGAASHLVGPVRLERVSSTELERRAAAGAGAAEPLLERRTADGLVLRITRSADSEYRIETPGHGLHLVSADGRRVLVAAEGVDGAAWRRALSSVVLPLAATLLGVELVHAAAVVCGGAAIGIAAPAGGGKSTTALHLRLAGAGFLTDDVLACTVDAGRVVAHPGPGLANVARDTWDGLSATEAAHAGRVVGRSDKLHVACAPRSTSLPLAALVVLERGRSTDGALVLTDEVPTLAAFAEHAYVPLIDGPARLLATLGTWEAMARQVPVLRAAVPGDLTPRAVATALWTQLRDRLDLHHDRRG